MEIFLNKNKIEVGKNLTLLDVLTVNGLHQKTGIAVAVNSLVIPKNKWINTKLNANDNIMVITATAGG